MDQYIPGSTPDPNAGVWPPPPTSLFASPQALTFPFKTIFQYVKPSSVPLFRVGTVSLYPEGVSIQGKAVTRYEVQASILAISLFLRLFLVAYLIMEYGIRRDEFLNVLWSDVKEVVLVPKKRRVCLVYNAPNYKGIIKTFSLTFNPGTAYYDAFVGSVTGFLPDRVIEGKLRPWTSPPVWIFCTGIVIALIFLGIIAATSPQSLNSIR